MNKITELKNKIAHYEGLHKLHCEDGNLDMMTHTAKVLSILNQELNSIHKVEPENIAINLIDDISGAKNPFQSIEELELERMKELNKKLKADYIAEILNVGGTERKDDLHDQLADLRYTYEQGYREKPNSEGPIDLAIDEQIEYLEKIEIQNIKYSMDIDSLKKLKKDKIIMIGEYITNRMND